MLESFYALSVFFLPTETFMSSGDNSNKTATRAHAPTTLHHPRRRAQLFVISMLYVTQ